MQIKKLLSLLFISSCLSVSAFAAEPIAKEDMTPPLPEGALTADQIPPIHTLPKPIVKPSQSTQPATVPDSTAPATMIPSAPTPPADFSRPTDTTAVPILNAPIANPPSPPSSPPTNNPSAAPTDTVIPIQPVEPPGQPEE